MRNRGFTLLEMMVVIIIIGTIAAIAVPRMNDIFEVNLKSSIRRMIGMIQFAFNESVIKQTPLRLNFSPETGEYWLSAMLSSGDTGQFVEYVTDVVKPQQLPEGVLINDVVTPHDSEKRTDGDDIFIGFFPTGFVERGVIHLSSRDGRQFTLVIEPLTGKVNVLDGYIDIVQDAMMKLAERYGDHPVAEYPMLFQRILQNTIRDYYRRQKVRSFWTTLFSSFTPQHDAEDFDPLDTLQDNDNASQPSRPEEALAQSQLISVIEGALSQLPARQREAFLLRYWEELDTAETAAAMGCSEGSVKTHCSRATHALSAILREKGIDLS